MGKRQSKPAGLAHAAPQRAQQPEESKESAVGQAKHHDALGAYLSEDKHESQSPGYSLGEVQPFAEPESIARRVAFFLSHRGPDTKDSLARPLAFLLSRLEFDFFFDDDSFLTTANHLKSMRLMERNDIAMSEGTYGSETGVAIISPNFHKSKWCMRELATLARRHESLLSEGKPGCLLPIFYGVSLDDPHYKGLSRTSCIIYKNEGLVTFLLQVILPALLSLQVSKSTPAQPNSASSLMSLQPRCRLTNHLQHMFQPAYKRLLESTGLHRCVLPAHDKNVACQECPYHRNVLDIAARECVEGIGSRQLDQYKQDLHFYLPPYVHDGVPKNIDATIKLLDSAIDCSDESKLSASAKSARDHITTLQDALHDFLSPEQPHPLLLLSGEAGSGKTLASIRLLSELCGLSPNTAACSWEWIPVRLELKYYAFTDLQERGMKDLLADTGYGAISGQLTTRNTVFILDGYDELRGLGDAIRNGQCISLLEQLQVRKQFPFSRVIVTCRHSALTSFQTFQIFSHGDDVSHLKQRFLLPFSMANVKRYVEHRHSNSIGLSSMPPEHRLTWSDCEGHLQASPDLCELVRVPFVLRLFVDALPHLSQRIAVGDLSRISRYFIYESFLSSWFRREFCRMPDSVRARLGLGGPAQAERTFLQLSEALAFAMFSSDTLVIQTSSPDQELGLFDNGDDSDGDSDDTDSVHEQKQSDAFRTWLQLEATVREHCHKAHQRRLQTSSLLDHAAIKMQSPDQQATAILQQFLKSCPLRMSDGQYSFVHKTFYEYFVVGFMLRPLTKLCRSNRPLKPSAVSSTLAAFGERVFHRTDPSMVRLIRDRLMQSTPLGGHTRTDSDRTGSALRDRLWQALLTAQQAEPLSSRPASPVDTTAVDIAISNIISILNLSGWTFAGSSLKNLRIVNANLSRAVLCGVKLVGCSLSRCNLHSAYLNGSVFDSCELDDCDFGAYSALHNLPGLVTCVALSPSGNYLAGGFDNSTLRVWNSATSEIVADLKGHSRWVTALRFSPDSRTIASGSKDTTIRIWDAASGTMLHQLQKHSDWVTSVCFTRDGRHVMSSSQDSTLCLWDVCTGALTRAFEGHAASVLHATVSTNGFWLASSAQNNTIHVWDISSGAIIRKVEDLPSPAQSIDFSPDGHRLVGGLSNAQIHVWDVSTGERTDVWKGHFGKINAVCFSPDGVHVASASDDQSIRIWDALTGIPVQTLRGHAAWVTSLSFSSDASHLVSGSFDRSIRTWNLPARETVQHNAGHGNWVTSVCFSPNDNHLASGSQDRCIRVWDLASGETVHTLTGHSGQITHVCFNHDGTRLASSSADNTIRVWDMATGDSIIHLDEHSNRVTSLSFSMDGTQFATASYDKTVRIWDTTSGEVLKCLQADSLVESVCFSPSGGLLAAGLANAKVCVWDLSGSQSCRQWDGHSDSVQSIRFSRCGALLASGSRDKTVRIWDTSTGETVHALQGHLAAVHSVCFRPDGKTVASGSEDGQLCVWNVSDGALARRLLGHSSRVTSVDFDSNGTRLASGSYDESVRVWSVVDPNVYPNLITVRCLGRPALPLSACCVESKFIACKLPSQQKKLLSAHGASLQ